MKVYKAVLQWTIGRGLYGAEFAPGPTELKVKKIGSINHTFKFCHLLLILGD